MDNKFTYMSNQILRNMMSIRKGIVMLVFLFVSNVNITKAQCFKIEIGLKKTIFQQIQDNYLYPNSDLLYMIVVEVMKMEINISKLASITDNC